MTLAVLVIRHGKSDWNNATDSDLDRTINRRGRESADAVGRFLGAAGVVPDTVLCSPAVRTQQTAGRVATAAGWSTGIETCEQLYLGSTVDVLDLIRARPATDELVAAIGHEPTSSELVSLLVGGGSHRLATATVALVGLAARSWRDVEPGSGQLLWLLPPRPLLAAGV